MTNKQQIDMMLFKLKISKEVLYSAPNVRKRTTLVVVTRRDNDRSDGSYPIRFDE